MFGKKEMIDWKFDHLTITPSVNIANFGLLPILVFSLKSRPSRTTFVEKLHHNLKDILS